MAEIIAQELQVINEYVLDYTDCMP